MENFNTYPKQDEELEIDIPVDNEITFRNRKPRELKKAKDELKKNKTFSLSKTAIEALENQSKYFHKNLTETLERIILNSYREILESEEDRKHRKASKDFDSILKIQNEMIVELSSKITDLEKNQNKEVGLNQLNPRNEELEAKVDILENIVGCFLAQTTIPKETLRTEEDYTKLNLYKGILKEYQLTLGDNNKITIERITEG